MSSEFYSFWAGSSAPLTPSDRSQSPISFSTRASIGSTFTPPASVNGSNPVHVICLVVCLHDFETTDPDQLSFTQNEILAVVKQEDSGWWAALRNDDSRVGWIPSAFVEELSEGESNGVRDDDEESRWSGGRPESWHSSAPPRYSYSFSPTSYADQDDLFTPQDSNNVLPLQLVASPDTIPPYQPSPVSMANSNDDKESYFDELRDSRRSFPPPYMPSPTQRHSVKILLPAPVRVNKRAATMPLASSSTNPPTPPPLSPKTDVNPDLALKQFLDQGNPKRRPMLSINPPQPPRRRASESSWVDVTPATSTDASREVTVPSRLSKGKSVNKNALDAHTAQMKSPRDDILLAEDGSVKAGTLAALVQKLIADPSQQEKHYRDAFLMTFRTFTTADELFDMLVQSYEINPPADLTSSGLEEWRAKWQGPTRKRILMIFLLWLEDHGLLDEEPWIANQITHFLTAKVTPSPMKVTAKLILDSIHRLTFAGPDDDRKSAGAPRRPRKSKPHKNKLLRLDPADVAEQLCLMEHKSYSKIRPQECLNWIRAQAGAAVTNFFDLSLTHERLTAWVKMCVLDTMPLGRRSDTVDFWIKVAEKCHNHQNHSSMSAVLAALSSSEISDLHLTWVHTGRRSNFETLLKHHDPAGSFEAYCNLLQATEGPCIPAFATFGRDLHNIHGETPDTFSSPTNPDTTLISFSKRRHYYEIISIMLRHQRTAYNFAENDLTAVFINGHLQAASFTKLEWYRTRLKQVHESEVNHLDIRKDLEAAGF